MQPGGTGPAARPGLGGAPGTVPGKSGFGGSGFGGSGFGAPGFGAPGFGAPAANAGQSSEPDQPAKPLTAEERRARNQQEAALNQQALRLLRMAEVALKRKQNDVARNYCDQILALAPDSPSAKSAKQMLDRLNK